MAEPETWTGEQLVDYLHHTGEGELAERVAVLFVEGARRRGADTLLLEDGLWDLRTLTTDEAPKLAAQLHAAAVETYGRP